jgi:hypothetical protein
MVKDKKTLMVSTHRLSLFMCALSLLLLGGGG